MNKQSLYLIILALMIVILLQRSCTKEDVYISLPEKKGSFEPKVPEIKADSKNYIVKWREIEVKTQNPVNDSLVEAYKQAKDSLERFKRYVHAIEIKDFKTTFSDDLIKIDIFGEVQGDINQIQADYTLKERKVRLNSVEDEKVIFRVLAGGEIGFNQQSLSYEVGLMFQPKSKNLYKVGYSRFKNKNYFVLGFYPEILSF